MTRPTNEVTNQSTELVDYNLFTTNPALVDALAREARAADHERIVALGERLGRAEMFALGDAANRNPPVLELFDRFGGGATRSSFIPAWHELMRRLVAEGLHTGPWSRAGPGAHAARAAGYMLWAEIENGTQCPATMTYGAVPTLARQPEDFGEWLPLLLSREYDPRFIPAKLKRGALDGHGHDGEAGRLGCPYQHHACRTRRRRGARAGSIASPATSGSSPHRCAMRSWCSRRPPGGLVLLLRAALLPDRHRNTLRLQRLKDKLGNRSNASSEVEFEDAYGAAGRGGRPRHPDDSRDGRVYPPRQRGRLRGPHAAVRVAGRSTTRSSAAPSGGR